MVQVCKIAFVRTLTQSRNSRLDVEALEFNAVAGLAVDWDVDGGGAVILVVNGATVGRDFAGPGVDKELRYIRPQP